MNSAGRVLIVTTSTPHPSKGASNILFYEYICSAARIFDGITHVLITGDDQEERNYVEYRKAIEDMRIDVVRIRETAEDKTIRKGLCYELALSEGVRSIGKYKEGSAMTVCFDIKALMLAKELDLAVDLCWLGDLWFQTNFVRARYAFRENRLGLIGLVKGFAGGLLWKNAYRRALRGVGCIKVSSASSEAQLERIGIESKYLPYPWPVKKDRRIWTCKESHRNRYLFFGMLAGLGSVSALHILTEELVEELRKIHKNEEFKIVICGNASLSMWIEKRVRKINEIAFKGYVEDLYDEISKARAIVVPVDVPVGNRSRIVTGMAAGAPMVCHKNTSLGNRDLKHRYNCLLGRNGRELARQLAEINQDDLLAQRLGRAALLTYGRTVEPEKACREFWKYSGAHGCKQYEIMANT